MRSMSEDPNVKNLAALLGDKSPSDLRMKNSAQEHDDDAMSKSIRDNWKERVKEGMERMELLSR
jgi:hypothetical protein